MEIETEIEKRLIEALTMGNSQWTYCDWIHNEEDLDKNFKSILETNNIDKLNGIPLSDAEFQRVKNQVVSSSSYEAGIKLQGENGLFQVRIDRENKPIMLNVFNRYNKAGGSSVYQVINQYNAFYDDNSDVKKNRRFDLTFLFNGLPLIHMELKNGRSASYLEAFNQIKKYIGEGHFKGLFSLVQMFVVSNEVQTMYIAANRDMKKEFLTSWTDENDPDKTVSDLFEFSRKVLSIPAAHEMVTDYCQLNETNKELMILRPYQIQAINAIRKAYTEGKSGYIWHTTGSGKTLTSYKASRNMLFDIPGLDKTVFLIDRRDLDDKTNRDFESYASNDSIKLTGTDDVRDLKKRLAEDYREMIITTRQKLQNLIEQCNAGKVRESDVLKMKSKRIAFVVDECHRTITRPTQIEIDSFFDKTMWYGFTGTPIFAENMGALGATTEQMYGQVLHKYTIKNALHDKAVLGFQVERRGPSGLNHDDDGNEIDEDLSVYESEKHMLGVIDIIVNKSIEKFNLHRGQGSTYEALLTVGSIRRAQKYYELFMKVKRGESSLKIDSKIIERFPDFPKVAVTYSLKDNKESYEANQSEMSKAIHDYNEMFCTNFIEQNIDAYNVDLTERFSRKSFSRDNRSDQLDLVIVADRLLTGFDAPSLSTVFMDRQPMVAHSLIQAFSRTNRLFDANKTTGYIVTFQSPGSYKNAIDNALELFSLGGQGEVLAPPFEEALKGFEEALLKLRSIAPDPSYCGSLVDDRDKRKYCLIFQQFDAALQKVKGYIEWQDKDLESDYGLSEKDHHDYIAWYNNFMDSLHKPDDGEDDDSTGVDVNVDYVLQSYGTDIIDYRYVLMLIQKHREESDDLDENVRKKREEEIEKLVCDLERDAPKRGAIIRKLWNDTKENKLSDNRDINCIFDDMVEDAKNIALHEVSDKYCLKFDDVKYSSENYNILSEDIPNFDVIWNHVDKDKYQEKVGRKIKPIEYRRAVRSSLEQVFRDDIIPYNLDN